MYVGNIIAIDWIDGPSTIQLWNVNLSFTDTPFSSFSFLHPLHLFLFFFLTFFFKCFFVFISFFQLDNLFTIFLFFSLFVIFFFFAFPFLPSPPLLFSSLSTFFHFISLFDIFLRFLFFFFSLSSPSFISICSSNVRIFHLLQFRSAERVEYLKAFWLRRFAFYPNLDQLWAFGMLSYLVRKRQAKRLALWPPFFMSSS